MQRPVVDLYPWEYERGCSVGIARFTANWGKPDAPHYDRSRMEDDRTAQVAAALCEIAVARYVNQYCHLHVWHHTERHKYRHLADVGTDIEVRRIRTAKGVPIRVTDAGKQVWAARVLGNEFRKVEVLGFAPADEHMHRRGDKTWFYLPLEELSHKR